TVVKPPLHMATQVPVPSQLAVEFKPAVHGLPQAPQSVFESSRVSHPSAGSMLQSPHVAMHSKRHTPRSQLGTALATPVQEISQRPQWAGSAKRFVHVPSHTLRPAAQDTASGPAS